MNVTGTVQAIWFENAHGGTAECGRESSALLNSTGESSFARSGKAKKWTRKGTSTQDLNIRVQLTAELPPLLSSLWQFIVS